MLFHHQSTPLAYNLETTLDQVLGIGEKTFFTLKEKNIFTIGDLLLNLPLHYVDRSQMATIADLNAETEITFIATVTSTNNFYKSGLSIQSAHVKDDSSTLKLTWFNNKFILQKLQKGEKFLFSGKLNKKGKLVQPVVENLGQDNIHTGRIVPVYTSTLGLKIGSLRRVLKRIIDNLKIESKSDLSSLIPDLQPLQWVLTQLHYPDSPANLVKARERLALEELLSLIKKSNQIKTAWQKIDPNRQTLLPKKTPLNLIPESIPFALTLAQKKSLKEILADLKKPIPMNRLLIGDVGSGKTVVAGLAARQILTAGASVALIAPTKILAHQHFATLKKLFPELKIELLQVSKKLPTLKKTFYIGTHGLVNRLEKIKPALIIYDEQHRFGVTQRSKSKNLSSQPHILTMTATPIPRSLILTIFSHLNLSTIDELPAGRKPVRTWLITEKKRLDAYHWLAKELQKKPKKSLSKDSHPQQAIFICPFIEKSEHEAFGQITSVSEKFTEINKYFGDKFTVALLHGRLKKEEQEKITTRLFAGQIDILVTTPIVEVGIDLPTANFIIIENSERFGLASLHQLRGRVGRRGQQAYCLLFTPSKTPKTKQRLAIFATENNGLKLAEFDLKNRGAGDIFGIEQSGFDNLKFANWANIELISHARQIYNKIEGKSWQPLIKIAENNQKQTKATLDLPLAN